MPVPPHAEPVRAVGGPVGVLLLHGFTGGPASVRPWAEHLASCGFAVSAPRLPGHGTTWQEMNTTTWRDWYGEAARALDELRAECDAVFVAGLSMGGCLALRLAQERGSDVAGLVLVNPSVTSADRRLLLTPLLKRLVPSVEGVGNDVKRAGVVEHAYDRVPLRALDSLRELWKVTGARLRDVTCPLLIFRSAVDHVVDPSSVRLVRERVSSTDVTERVLHDSYHVATLDNDAPLIFAESAAFVGDRAPAERRDAV